MDLTKPLLGLFAHPDDETFGMAGTLALVHRSGGRVGVFSATRGEKGKLNLPEPMTDDELGRLRELELEEAARILGVDQLYVWNYPDGGVDAVPQEELVGVVEDVIRSFEPYTVVTFSPEGGTGHRDHVAMHKIATLAFHKAQASMGRPPAELYYRAVPASVLPDLAAYRSQRQRTAGHYHEGLEAENNGDTDLERIDITPVLNIKESAALAHASQNPQRFLNRSSQIPSIPDEFWVSEYFYRAWPR
jgi:LmbE family N-acetylglucosaminyl deacetylase